jgi:hypothetical protein
MIEVRSPVNQFFDVDGTPLDAGYIYIGVSGANPETSPQVVYWDKEGTIPAAQPLRTLNGYPSREGAVAKFYTATKNYSITIKDKRGILVMSTLDSDSGIFDELAATTGAASIGYDNAVSELVGDTVQEAIDELKVITDAQDVIINSSLYGFNLFPNSAFTSNSKGYASGDPTTTPNEETLDNLYVINTGEYVTFSAATFGNTIIAPANGAYATIEGGSITGGQYACKWEGSGTIRVNGVFYEKSSPFTLTATNDATVTLTGQFSNFQFTRPNMLGLYEYDEKIENDKALWKGGTGASIVASGTTAQRPGDSAPTGADRLNSTTGQREWFNGTDWETAKIAQGHRQSVVGMTTIDIADIPAYVNDIEIWFDSASLSGTDHFLVQLGDSGGFITTGYVSNSIHTSTSASAGTSSTAGFLVYAASAGASITARLHIKKWRSGTRLFTSTHAGRANTTTQVVGGGSITMTNEVTQIRITRTGTNTGDAGEVAVFWG